MNVDPEADLIPPSPFKNAQFTSTHWSLVLEAAASHSHQSSGALEKLFTDISYEHFHADFRAEGFLGGDSQYSSFLMHLSAAGQGEESHNTFVSPQLTEIRFGK